MQILVYGAGVIGSLIGARLQANGQQVDLLARGNRQAELKAHGVVLLDEATGRHTVTRVGIKGSLEPEDRYDLIVVAMRKNQVAQVLPALSANRVTPTILFMANNGAGSDEWVKAVGRERVVLGFPGAGGAKEGPIIRYLITSRIVQPTTFGELDGRNTPRLQRIVEAFRSAGFPVAVSSNMDAWLRTHAALVVPVANALLLHGGSNYALSRSPGDVRLLVEAVREGFRAIQALGLPVEPAKLRLLERIPTTFLVAVLRRAFATHDAELLLSRHTRNAADEIRALSEEVLILTRSVGTRATALHLLHRVHGESVALE